MGRRRKRLLQRSGIAKSVLGRIQGGVRWKTISWPAAGAISGMNWMALAPVPVTAMRLPSRGTLASQSVEWKAGPANFSSPLISGYFGTCRPPTAETNTRDRMVAPSAVVTRQSELVSSHDAWHIAVFKRIYGARP